MSGHNQRLGQRGEDAAADWYRTAGYEVVERNWRVAEGEIDLICRRSLASGVELVVCEVKTRSSQRYGSGFDAVGWKKQQKVRALARRWLDDADRFYSSVRFDVVDVDARGHVQVLEGCF